MNKLIISFIIPIFNCERYLEKCLNSILNQGLDEEEYEVIIINDGSKDGSEKIITYFINKFKNLNYISQTNTGVGRARNKGLTAAKGEYIYFMDADDYLIENGFRTLIDKYLYKNSFPNILIFNSITIDKYYNDKYDSIKSHKIVFNGIVNEYLKNNQVGFSVWNCLISRNLLLASGITFSDHKIAEDMLFMVKLFSLKDSTIVSTNLNIYRYRVNTKGTFNSINKNHIRNLYFDLIDIVMLLEKFKSHSAIPLNILNRDINICKRWAFTRLCTGGFKYPEIITFIKYAKNKKIFPINQAGIICKLINLILKSSFITYVFSIFYRYLFIPFLKPFIKRN